MRYETKTQVNLNTQISILKSNRTFFDILEEVIKKRRQQYRGLLQAFEDYGKVKRRKASVLLLDTKYLILKTATRIKKHTYRAKGGIVEESKKGYTGDALALRGDERRDKLR